MLLTPIINLPANFTTDVTANASQIVADLASPTTLIIGVLLAVTVITVLIKTIRG